MPFYQSNAELSFNFGIDVNFDVQNSPEARKDNLSSVANIIHVLLNASNMRNIWHIRHNANKYPGGNSCTGSTPRARRATSCCAASGSIAGGTSWPACPLHSRTLRNGIAKGSLLCFLWSIPCFQLKDFVQLSSTLFPVPCQLTYYSCIQPCIPQQSEQLRRKPSNTNFQNNCVAFHPALQQSSSMPRALAITTLTTSRQLATLQL
ncbi:hypothetical protein BN14_07489 [Rhizoctonia solani AG-1 IB]|uniref:Uncharacterized protein n=1 Tax=Thanatephorus cucumeris (strain AG1-IB / isolate 7/3/14) TaxID=1108050 RepID=M5C1Z6_THACB|nr:hypothetical protein BN14_07489 [Rhizoctonia solani AG-1 IB]